jgi:iron(III) transport system substrate-binding protein
MGARYPVLFAAIAVLGCGESRTPLVVYSPHGRDLLLLAERTFEAANPDVDVRWLDMGSQDALDRIRSERANPQADVWFGGPSTLFRRAAADSLLQPYRPSWADAVPADEAPQDWQEVLAPQWSQKVVIREPLGSGTMRTIFGMVIERSLAATGDTAAGFDWLRRLDAQTKEYVFNPALLHQKLLRQEGLITLWDLPDILVEQDKGSPFAYTLPHSGTPVIEDAIAVVRGAEQLEVAHRFVEWAGSVEAQLLAAHQAFRLPARTDLALDSLPAWARDVRERLIVADIDWELLSQHGAAWMTHWDRHVRGRGTAGRR